MIRFKGVALISLCLLAGLTSACGRGTLSTKTVAASATPTNIAESPGWQQKGSQLQATGNYTASWESLPIKISGPGTYTVDIGPVPTTLNLNAFGGYAITLPPDAHFSFKTSELTKTTVNGLPYIQTQVTISPPDEVYSGFRFWLSQAISTPSAPLSPSATTTPGSTS